jgi:hypothetical protein
MSLERSLTSDGRSAVRLSAARCALSVVEWLGGRTGAWVRRAQGHQSLGYLSPCCWRYCSASTRGFRLPVEIDLTPLLRVAPREDSLKHLRAIVPCWAIRRCAPSRSCAPTSATFSAAARTGRTGALAAVKIARRVGSGDAVATLSMKTHDSDDPRPGRAICPYHVRVGRGLVTLAKVLVLENFTEDVAQLTSAWLSRMGAASPSRRPRSPPEPWVSIYCMDWSRRVA